MNSSYETVAASQTDQVLGPVGAAGDYLDRLICVVATQLTSTVDLQDGAGTAFNVLPANVGGGIGTYVIEVKAHSRAGAWSVTTAAGVSVIAVGNFT